MQDTYILGPSPAQINGDNGTSGNWAKSDTTNYRESIKHNCRSPLFRRPDVAQHAAGVGDRSGAEETSEEAGQEGGLSVSCGSRSESEASSNEVRNQYCGPASIYLTQRRPKKRSEPKSQQEKSRSKQRDFICDMKFSPKSSARTAKS